MTKIEEQLRADQVDQDGLERELDAVTDLLDHAREFINERGLLGEYMGSLRAKEDAVIDLSQETI